MQVRRPVQILEIKNIKVSDKVSQGIETINDGQLFNWHFILDSVFNRKHNGF